MRCSCVSRANLVVVRADTDTEPTDGLFAGVAEVEHMVVVQHALLLLGEVGGEDAAGVRLPGLASDPGVRQEAEAYGLSRASLGLSDRSFLLSFFLSAGFLSFSAFDMRLFFN